VKKSFKVLIASVVILNVACVVFAQDWGAAFKSTAQAVVVQKLSPQAQQIVDEAKELGGPAKQENFIIAKAKEYLAAGNYQTALDLANYVKTMLDSKSFDAMKIMADAQAALTKMMPQKAIAVP
jgi:hypothetical protein